jgi:hypothetical protein
MGVMGSLHPVGGFSAVPAASAFGTHRPCALRSATPCEALHVVLNPGDKLVNRIVVQEPALLLTLFQTDG